MKTTPFIDKLNTDDPYDKTIILTFPGQAVCIYSLIEARILYASGWKEVLGYEDTEINIRLILQAANKGFSQSLNELNKRAWLFLCSKKERLEEYAIAYKLQCTHKDGSIVSVFSSIAVFKTDDGKIEQIIGLAQKIPFIKRRKLTPFICYGPKKEEFEKSLSKEVFYDFSITKKEKQALKLASNGYAFKEIAHELGVTKSAVEKRIIPMYKRYRVKSLSHLISFAYENNLLP